MVKWNSLSAESHPTLIYRNITINVRAPPSTPPLDQDKSVTPLAGSFKCLGGQKDFKHKRADNTAAICVLEAEPNARRKSGQRS